jgi:cysteine-S-conjugate beta-lyase
MMTFDFTRDVDRRGTNSAKWTYFGEDVLPMWVADTEFGVPPQVIEAIKGRLEHPVFGYQMDEPALRNTIAERMRTRYGWHVEPEWVLLMSGLVLGLNLVSKVVGEAGDGVIITPPVYPPFMHAPHNFGREIHNAPLTMTADGHILHYELDLDALERAVTPRSRLVLFCNPHNPSGRVFSRADLEVLIAFCQRHSLTLCSDEIHSDLIYAENQHIPVAMLSPDFAPQTITLVAPSKTFNMPGLGNAAAIVPDKALRTKIQMAMFYLGAMPNALGHAAANAAYTYGDDWLAALMTHLQGNRDFIIEYARERMPGVRVTRPEATYLTWMDFRDLHLENPFKFFLENAKVALTNGADFGAEGQGFARLNFGCSRSMLEQALEKMRVALYTNSSS